MYRLLFVCHGNICRSVMAEFVFRALAAEQGRAGCFEVASAATSREEIGNPIYPDALRCLQRHGVAVSRHAARQVTRADYDGYDRLVLMDRHNVRNLRGIIPDDPDGKVSLLLEHVDPSLLGRDSLDVADPWYTRDFEAAYDDILLGCRALLEELS